MANEIHQQRKDVITCYGTVPAGTTPGETLKVTGDEAFGRAGAGETPKGYLFSPREASGRGEVVLIGSAIQNVKLGAALAAGAEVKCGADASGVQTVVAFVDGTDAEKLRLGWLLVGGASGATGKLVRK